jgi:uncharacterized protein
VPDDLLPLMPLGFVLMPGLALPLRIFEPRYRRMLADVTAAGVDQHFGVVALTAGLEVDNGLDECAQQFSQIGTVAEILEVHPAPDGTFSLLTGGSRRFRVVRVVETAAPYLQAQVTYLDEVAGTMPRMLPGATRALTDEYGRLISQLTGDRPDTSDPYPTDDILLSYRLASEAPLSPDDRQQLLEDDTAVARFLHVQRVLRREVILLRRTRTVAIPPRLLQTALRPN